MEEISGDVLRTKPSLAELYEHIRVGSEWHKFGVLLKLNISKLDAIEHENEDLEKKALKMFEMWLFTNPNATRRDIIEVLKMMGEYTIAERYEKALIQSKQSTC